jgi:hypothetical protein
MIFSILRRPFARLLKPKTLKKDFDLFKDDFKAVDVPVAGSQSLIEFSDDEALSLAKPEVSKTKEEIEFFQKTLLYQGEDQFPEKLVHRPEKEVVWGLGGELIRI